jgi:Zn/Cd-binding protein ZinT
MTLGALLASGQLFAHSHGHQMTAAEQQAANGVFEDKDVEDRALSDWDGVWQSVYPFLLDGSLDPVFKKKAEKDEHQSFDQVKAYYRTGYATDVDSVGIENNVMEFHKGNVTSRCHYSYSGYKILTYASGKKGFATCSSVRMLAVKRRSLSSSATISSGRKPPRTSISLWAIPPRALLKEMDNWPTERDVQRAGGGRDVAP